MMPTWSERREWARVRFDIQQNVRRTWFAAVEAGLVPTSGIVRRFGASGTPATDDAPRSFDDLLYFVGLGAELGSVEELAREACRRIAAWSERDAPARFEVVWIREDRPMHGAALPELADLHRVLDVGPSKDYLHQVYELGKALKKATLDRPDPFDPLKRMIGAGEFALRTPRPDGAVIVAPSSDPNDG